MLNKIPYSLKFLLICSCIYTVFVLAYTFFVQPGNAQQKGDISTGERLFKKNCSGCHLNGANLIKAEKPIIGSSKILSRAVFSDFIGNPPPPMPKFKNITSNPEQFNELYKYVTSLMGK